MPKLKTKSICKRKFRITGTGKIRFKTTNKRHGMAKKSSRQNRENSKPSFLSADSSKFVMKKFLSYFKKLRNTKTM